MPKKFLTTTSARDIDNVCASQTVALNGSFLLNGAGCTAAGQGNTTAYWDITNAGSGLTGWAGTRLRWQNSTVGAVITITGLDQDGCAISEQLTGTAGTGVLDTKKFFSKVTSIATSTAAITSAEVIGLTYYHTTRTYPLDWRSGNPCVMSSYDPDGTGTTSAFTFQEYFGPTANTDFQSGGTTTPIATDGWNALLANSSSYFTATEGTIGATAVRVIATATDGAKIKLAFVQGTR